jgi:hypothetical protein
METQPVPTLMEIVAPDEYGHDGVAPAIFLAGGISGCPDWQADLCSTLRDVAIVFLNPRRRMFNVCDQSVTLEQIAWEYRHLRLASAIVFWFPEETLCPIALFELGAWCMTATPLFVGTLPAYSRRIDVEEQLRLARPDVTVHNLLSVLATQISEWRAKSA